MEKKVKAYRSEGERGWGGDEPMIEPADDGNVEARSLMIL